MKNTIKMFIAFAIAVLISVPAFADEPMTISGVWLREDVDGKIYYYFSPGGVDGTAVGVSVIPDILGGEQVILFTGTWVFEVLDGNQLFCVYRVRILVPGTNQFIRTDVPLPGRGTYRFFTERGVEKMEFIADGHRGGTSKEIWTKVGTRLSDLPELGVLSNENNRGGRLWARHGINVR